MSADQSLRDGGPWFSDHPQVTADGYLEDWGHQQATAVLGPSVDGLSRGSGATISVSSRAGGGLIRNQEDNFR